MNGERGSYMIPGIVGADAAIGLGCGDLGFAARDVIHLGLQCTNIVHSWPRDSARTDITMQ